MEYKEIKNLKQQVEAILVDKPVTRNSDIALTIAIWLKFYPALLIENGQAVLLKQLFKLPREDSIKRIRANFQNDKGMYLPTDEAVAKARGFNIEEWRVAMGYATTEGAYTPPSEKYKEYTFKSETTNATYTVKDLITDLVCDCPGFQFRHTCKHVDQIEGQSKLNTKVETENNMELF
jgi:hypothetical protein